MNLTHTLFSFSGRINRAKWWLSILIIVVLYMVLLVLMLAVPVAGFIFGILYVIAYLWIALAAGAKRLHDLDRTALWLVLFIGAPILLSVAFFAMAGAAAGMAILSGDTPDPAALAQVGASGTIIGLITLALAIWALVWFGCLRGTIGANQYGPDPLAGV